MFNTVIFLLFQAICIFLRCTRIHLELFSMFVMGFHGVDILSFAVKLNGLTTLRFSARAVFLVIVWSLHGLLFRLNRKQFTLLWGVSRSMQQACTFCASFPIARMSCMFFLFLPAQPFLGLVVEVASPPFHFLTWLPRLESSLIGVL